ncbi:hypothetical protein F5Y09DRAFT_61992 [Xylaria sp. FL1042]|nr:hypothetical protein F5Y09DRAFT_61992 [Xylaria sp. FL1042]
MDFIDPQLLGPDYVADTTHLDQGDWSCSNQRSSGNDVISYAPFSDIDSAYPVQPLDDANSSSPQHPWMASQPDYQAGFGPGVWANPQTPLPYYYTLPKPCCTRCNSNLCCPRCNDVDNDAQIGSQTAQSATEPASILLISPNYQLATPPKSPTPGSPADVSSEPRRYTLRKRRAKAPETPRSSTNMTDVAKTKPVQIDGLDKPLSEIVADLPNFRGVDMDAFIRRGKGQRIVKGKICRPLNPFMLYRHAYCKAVAAIMGVGRALQVSCILGASWRMESKEVRDRFLEYSLVEQDYHARMFPSYKFCPARGEARTSGRKRRRRAASKVDDAESAGPVDSITVKPYDDDTDDSDMEYFP